MRQTDFTGALLAGGQSRRFGSNKALARLAGCRLIEHPARVLAGLFTHRLLVTNTPDLYSFLGWPTVPDLLPGGGPLAGIQAALHHARTPFVFVAGCDMPSLSPELISFLCHEAPGHDVVLPRTTAGPEPLHAVYARRTLPQISVALAAGVRKIQEALAGLEVLEISAADLDRFSARSFRSFNNINFPADLRDDEG